MILEIALGIVLGVILLVILFGVCSFVWMLFEDWQTETAIRHYLKDRASADASWNASESDMLAISNDATTTPVESPETIAGAMRGLRRARIERKKAEIAAYYRSKEHRESEPS